MTMITTTHTQNFSQMHFSRGDSGFRFALTVLATAVVTLLLVPALALSVSYIAGGSATSTILFVYLFALMTNGPFLLAAFALIAGLIAMPRLMAARA